MKSGYKIINSIKKSMKTFSTAGGFILYFLYRRGTLYKRKGKYRKAIKYFQSGLNIVDRWTGRKHFKYRQLWQFHLENSYFLNGNSRVEDPLFSCDFKFVCNNENDWKIKNAAGVFELEITHLGLRIDGLCYDKKIEYAEVMINDQSLRRINIVKRHFFPGYFYFHIQREVLTEFPELSVLKIVSSSGHLFFINKHDSVQFTVPHGTGRLLSRIEEGSIIDKKGFFSPTQNEIQKRQNAYLEIYKPAVDFFQKQFDKSLFLMYGTLLGFFRSGDFIQGDDDFDAGYVSLRNNVSDVKEEAKNIVVELVLGGFICSFNRSGRLFRLHLKGADPKVHLDLRPLWYEEGSVWAHKQACMPLMLDDFIPVKEGLLRGERVLYPQNTESFLRAYYGPGWNVPDPGYSNASKGIPKKVIRKLNAVCITPKDFHEMEMKIKKGRKNHVQAGYLVSVGSHSLYPLDEYESLCGW